MVSRAARSLLLSTLLASAAAWAQDDVDAGVADETLPVDAGTAEPVAAPPEQPPAIGEPVADEATPPPSWFQKSVDINGYVSSRTTYQRARVGGLYPTTSVPQWGELLELNGQLKVSYTSRSFVYADVSLVGQFAGDYRTTDANGAEVAAPPADVPGVRPLVSANELYVLHEFLPELNVLVGKKRLVWGAGQAFNPTDILNVRKDPTDPTFQRAGTWMAKVEVPLESLAFSVLFSPQVTEQFNGLPAAFVTYPDWDKKDDQAHYLLAARAYALVGDADVNAILYFSNRYNDAFEKKLRFGASFSRIFFKYWELHGETLLQTGSARSYVNAACVTSLAVAGQCSADGKPVVYQRELESNVVRPQVLLGVRPQFEDESFLNVEYLYQGDGYTRSEFQDLVAGVDLISQAQALGINPSRFSGVSSFLSPTTADGTPNRFTFLPNAQHYVFITYSKPRIFDDFTAQLTTIANLQDLSTLWSPSISWSATEFLTLNLLGFFGVPGPDALAATVPSTGKKVSEYSLIPTVARVMFEARLFY